MPPRLRVVGGIDRAFMVDEEPHGVRNRLRRLAVKRPPRTRARPIHNLSNDRREFSPQASSSSLPCDIGPSGSQERPCQPDVQSSWKRKLYTSVSPPTMESATLRSSRIQLYCGAFLVDALNFAFVAIVSAHAQYALGADVVGIGTLAVAARIFYPMAAWFAGHHSDRHGSLRLIAFTLLTTTLLVIPGSFLAKTLWALVIANAAMRFCMGLFWAPLERQLSLASPGTTLWTSLGVFNLVWAAGAAIGSYVGPGAYARWGFEGALIGCLCISSMALLTLFSRRPDARPTGHDIPHENVDRATAMAFLRIGWCANLCASAASGALPFFFMHVARSRGLELESIGVLLAAHSAGQCLSFAWLWKSPRWHYSPGWLLGTQLICALAFAGCGLLTSLPLLLVCMGAIGSFAGISYYSSLYYGLNLRADEGRLSSIHEVVIGVGGCLGPLGCTVAAWTLPGVTGAAMFFLAALLLAGMLYELCLTRRSSSVPES